MSVEVRVPPGPARTVELLGAMTGGMGCKTFEELVASPNPGPTTYLLGSKTVDVFQDVSIAIKASFDTGTAAPVYGDCGLGAAGPVAPMNLPNLVAWFRADSLALADGSIVGMWNDSGPHGFNAVGAASYEPVFRDPINGINGHPSVDFNSNKRASFGTASSPLFDSTSGYTAFWVAEYATAGVPQEAVRMDFGLLSGAGYSAYLQFGATASGQPMGNGYDNTPAIQPVSGAAATGAPHVFAFVWNTGGGAAGTGYVELFMDGTSLGGASGFTSASSISNFTSGYLGGAGGGFAGEIGELAIYRQAHSVGDIHALQCSLGNKYGISVSGCP